MNRRTAPSSTQAETRPAPKGGWKNQPTGRAEVYAEIHPTSRQQNLVEELKATGNSPEEAAFLAEVAARIAKGEAHMLSVAELKAAAPSEEALIKAVNLLYREKSSLHPPHLQPNEEASAEKPALGQQTDLTI